MAQICADSLVVMKTASSERERGGTEILPQPSAADTQGALNKVSLIIMIIIIFLGLFVFCVTLKEIHKNCAAG